MKKKKTKNTDHIKIQNKKQKHTTETKNEKIKHRKVLLFSFDVFIIIQNK